MTPGDIGARPAADRQSEHDQHEAGKRRRCQHQRREDRHPHADHAVEIALAAGGRMGEAAQCQDEKHAGDQIEESCEIGHSSGLTCCPSCGTSPACAA